MTFENLQIYLLPLAAIGFFIWRRYSFKKVSLAIPDLLKKGAVVVDVRSPEEFRAGSSPGSLNIPVGDISKRSKELDPEALIVLCCASGARSGMAAKILKNSGFKNVVNAGPWTNTLQKN